jgi:hypothetical protein
LLGELFHVFKHLVDPFDHALAVDLDWPILDVPQRNVQHSSVLGKVDLLAREHVVSQLLEVGLFSKLDEQWQRIIVQEVLGEVEDNLGVVGFILEDVRILLEALRVVLEVVAEDDVLGELLVVQRQLFPSLYYVNS